jgi:hypothetical protein
LALEETFLDISTWRILSPVLGQVDELWAAVTLCFAMRILSSGHHHRVVLERVPPRPYTKSTFRSTAESPALLVLDAKNIKIISTYHPAITLCWFKILKGKKRWKPSCGQPKQTPLNTCHDRRGLDGATDGSTAPTKRCLSGATGRRYPRRPQRRVVLLVLLVSIWHDREMFGGYEGVRVDGFHSDGFDCSRRSVSAGWLTGGATDRPVGANRGLIGGSVDGLHRPQQRHVGLLVMVEQLT